MYKLKSDKLTDGTTVTNTVIRLSDNATIPFDPDNTDYQAYLAWLENGGIPLPAENT